MNFDDLRQSWQSQSPPARVALDPILLLKEVERNRRHFARTIFWRDTREIGIAALLVPLFISIAVKSGVWVFVLPAVACAGVALFMLADRWVQRRQKPATSDPLHDCVRASLREMNHQIWLLKNVLWWYLLPLGLSIEFVFGWFVWRFRAAGIWPALEHVLVPSLGCILLYWFLYWVNQVVVRKTLEPRRQELETLLANLDG